MHLQYTIFFDREKQAGGGNVKKPLPVRRGGVFGILCDEKPPFKQICLNGGLEQATGIYPQPEKQPTGLFFARCGVPACSIPRYACQRKRPPSPDGKNVTAHPRKQKRRATLRTGSSVTLVEQVTGIYPRPEKQPTGLFFARCGAPACSIPRYACQRKKAATRRPFSLEQVTGIEPALSAWEAEVLPLHHTCTVDL